MLKELVLGNYYLTDDYIWIVTSTYSGSWNGPGNTTTYKGHILIIDKHVPLLQSARPSFRCSWNVEFMSLAGFNMKLLDKDEIKYEMIKFILDHPSFVINPTYKELLRINNEIRIK